MVCSESELRLVDLFNFPVKRNFFERSNWVNLHGPARLTNNFCREKKLYHVEKQLLYLLKLNFERIVHNTEYVLRCFKKVWNFGFSKSRNSSSLRLLSRNSELQLEV